MLVNYITNILKTLKIITIQALIKGYLTRLHLRKPKDKMTIDIVNKMLDKYTGCLIWKLNHFIYFSFFLLRSNYFNFSFSSLLHLINCH